MKWELAERAPLPFKANGEERMLECVARIGDPLFGFLVYEAEEQDEYRSVFVVTEVQGVTESEPPILEQEQYLTCTIKWDACSHFYFGYGAEGGRDDNDGYLHLCGPRAIAAHCELVATLFLLAFQRMGREIPT